MTSAAQALCCWLGNGGLHAPMDHQNAHSMALAQSQRLLLYDDPHSEYCAKVKVVLHHKSLTWQTLPVAPCGTGSLSTHFQQHAPLGKIPVLVIQGCSEVAQPGAVQPPPGTLAAAHNSAQPQQTEVVLYESEVINEWLEEAYPDPPMLPQQPLLRAKARLIARFHDLYLEPALRKLYPQVAPSTRSAAAVSAAGQDFLQHLQHLDQHLLLPSTRLAVGNTLCLADCGYPALLHYAQLLFPVLELGQLDLEALGLHRVASWHAALCQEPAVMKVLADLQPAAREWLEVKLKC